MYSFCTCKKLIVLYEQACQNGLKCTFHMWSCHRLSLPLGVVWSDPISLILCLKMSPDSLIKAPVKVYFSVNVTSTLKQQAALQHTQR